MKYLFSLVCVTFVLCAVAEAGSCKPCKACVPAACTQATPVCGDECCVRARITPVRTVVSAIAERIECRRNARCECKVCCELKTCKPKRVRACAVVPACTPVVVAPVTVAVVVPACAPVCVKSKCVVRICKPKTCKSKTCCPVVPANVPTLAPLSAPVVKK